MPRAFFRNVAAVKIGGKLPTQVFQIEVDADGSPSDGYWRKRLGEGAIERHVKASASASPPAASSSVASDAEAVRKSTPKKGA